ncbi:MAG: sulfur carrier protein ThiS [Burkholderiales bacterium]
MKECARPPRRLSVVKYLCHLNIIIYFTHMISLTVNGTRHRFDNSPNVTQLLEQLDLKGKRIAVERNGEIVPRSRFADEVLCDGDKLEIVVAVGGG